MHQSQTNPSMNIQENSDNRDGVICCFSAKKYSSNHRLFYVLRRTASYDDSGAYYRESGFSSCSTRSTIVPDTATVPRRPFLDALLRQIPPWRHYRPARALDEEPADPQPPSRGPGPPGAVQFEFASYKSREEWESGAPARRVMDLRELLFVADFRQRQDAAGSAVQHCVSLCGERFGLSFVLEDAAEWTAFLDRLREAHVEVAKPIAHRIEYACNVVVRCKGLGKQTPDPKLQPVEPGPYRLLLLDSKLVFVRDSINRPALTLYYQWIRQMIRQQRQPLLRRHESLFGLELGHMADTGEGFIYFRVLDEPFHAEAVGPNGSGLPRSTLSDMLQTYMKDNSLVRQRRRTLRSNRSRQSWSSRASSRSSVSAMSSYAPSEARGPCSTVETLCSELDRVSLHTAVSPSGTIDHNSSPGTDETTSTPTVTKPPSSLSEAETRSSSAGDSARYLLMDLPRAPHAPAAGPEHHWRLERVPVWAPDAASLGHGDTSESLVGAVAGLPGFATGPPGLAGPSAAGPAPALSRYVSVNEAGPLPVSPEPGAWAAGPAAMMGVFMADVAADRTQRANSVGSKPAPRETGAPMATMAMARCRSDILGDSRNARDIRWEASNAHRPSLGPPVGPPTAVAGDGARPGQDLYVDYLPAVALERTASAGAHSGLRPAAPPAGSGPSQGAEAKAVGQPPLCFGCDAVPMVAALSLVNTASTSTRSQLNSCSTSSSAVQLPDAAAAAADAAPVDDYGLLQFPPDFRLLS